MRETCAVAHEASATTTNPMRAIRICVQLNAVRDGGHHFGCGAHGPFHRDR